MAAQRADECYLGIDAGGTKTMAVLIAADGTMIGVGEAGPANHVTVGIESARAAIVSAVEEALQGAGRLPTAITLGSAGLEQPGDLQLAPQLLPSALCRMPIVFDTDAIIALEGALGGQAGVVVAAGTGSIAIGRDQLGKRVYAGGWGWRAGDEGSGYWIGQRVLAAIFRAADGRGPQTALESAVITMLGLPDCMALRNWVYADNRLPTDIAGLAPLVDTAAFQGDAVAQAILADAATELAVAALAVAKALHMQEGRVSYTGGLFGSSQLRKLFALRVQELQAGLVVVPPLLPPCGGAALHAWRLGQALRQQGLDNAVDNGTDRSNELWRVAIPAYVVTNLRQSLDWNAIGGACFARGESA